MDDLCSPYLIYTDTRAIAASISAAQMLLGYAIGLLSILPILLFWRRHEPD